MSAVASCAALAVLELDAVLVAQTLMSRPFVVGAAMGALGGRPEAGAVFGAAFELLGLVDLPVGGCLTWSAPVASGVAVVLLCAGTSFAPCFAGGLLAGLAHARLEALERARRAASGEDLARRAEEGGVLGLAMGRSIAEHAAMTFVVSGAVAAAVFFADAHFWPRVPELFKAGATAAVSSAPWIGLSGVAAWGLNRA